MWLHQGVWEDDFFRTGAAPKGAKPVDDERAAAVDAEAREAPLVPDRPDPSVRLIDPNLLNDEVDDAPAPAPQGPDRPVMEPVEETSGVVVEAVEAKLQETAAEAEVPDEPVAAPPSAPVANESVPAFSPNERLSALLDDDDDDEAPATPAQVAPAPADEGDGDDAPAPAPAHEADEFTPPMLDIEMPDSFDDEPEFIEEIAPAQPDPAPLAQETPAEPVAPRQPEPVAVQPEPAPEAAAAPKPVPAPEAVQERPAPDPESVSPPAKHTPLAEAEAGELHDAMTELEDHDDRPHVDVLINPTGPALHDPRAALAALRDQAAQSAPEAQEPPQQPTLAPEPPQQPTLAPEPPAQEPPAAPARPHLGDVTLEEGESLSNMAHSMDEDVSMIEEIGDDVYEMMTETIEPEVVVPEEAFVAPEPSFATAPMMPRQPTPGVSSVSELTDMMLDDSDESDDDEDWDIPELELDLSGPRRAAPAAEVVVEVEEPEDEGFGAQSLADTESQYAVSASRAVFDGPTTLSLLTRTEQDIDELDPVFSAFQDLQEGQYGFIHTVVRPYPEFRNDSTRYISTLKTGVDPGAHSEKSKGTKIYEALRWAVEHLWYEGNKSSKNLGPSSPPSKPWSGPSDVKPLSFSAMDDETKQTIKDAEAKSRSQAHYEARLYLGVIGKADDKADLDRIRVEAESGFVGYNTSYQRLAFERVNGWDAVIGFMPPEHESKLCLSAEELGELIRMPDDVTDPQGIDVKYAPFKPLLPKRPLPSVSDAMNPDNGIIPLGNTRPGTKNQQTVGIPNLDLDHHLVLFGRTGSGKSELIKRMIYGVVKAGMPVVVVDPHGQLNDDMLHMLVAFCPERRKDIVMLDVGDEDWPVAINPLDIRFRHQLEPTVEAVMAMISRTLAFDPKSATRAANYIRVALLALGEANLRLQDPDSKCTLMQVPTFFLNDLFRHHIMEFCTNVTAKEQFDPENGQFEKLGEGLRAEHMQAVLRPFQTLGSRQAFANVFAAGQNKLDFPSLMGGKKIVLLKMARFNHQKALGELVGALVIPWIVSSMESWARRKDEATGNLIGMGMRLFIDECHTVMSNSAKDIEDMMAETRKYDVGLIAGTQFPRQLGDTREAFYNNTGSKITFVLDPAGIAGFDKSLDAGAKQISAEDIVALPKYVGYCNLLVDRGNTGPFSIAFLRPLDEGFNRQDPEHKVALQRVIDQSRALVCNARADVESKMLQKTDTIMQALTALIQEKDSDDRDDLGLDAGDGSVNWSGYRP